MDESTEKAFLRCVFRVFTVSYDPASHPEDLFHMTFAKLSEGSSFPAFGGCDQLLFAQPSKIASRRGITPRRKQCTRHYRRPPLSNRDCQFVAPLIFFPFHPLADVLRTVLQLSSHPPRNLSETSLRRDLPASRLVSPKRYFCSPHQRAPSTPRPLPPSCAHLGKNRDSLPHRSLDPQGHRYVV